MAWRSGPRSHGGHPVEVRPTDPPCAVPAEREGDLRVLKDLIEDGNITPVIDKTFPLSEAADAIRYIEAGRARGKILLAV